MKKILKETNMPIELRAFHILLYVNTEWFFGAAHPTFNQLPSMITKF